MTSPARQQGPVYDPTCFDVQTVEDAAKVILTPEAGLTTNERWQHEAPALMRLIVEHIEPDHKTILDYGCGVGRLAKPLIGYHDCTVIGADISSSMRALATSCVDSNHFIAVPPGMMSLFDMACDHALAIWTLQHCLVPNQDIDRIFWALKPDGKLFVVNNVYRAIPVRGGKWADDHIDVRALLQQRFVETAAGQLDETIAPSTLRENTFWAVYEKR